MRSKLFLMLAIVATAGTAFISTASATTAPTLIMKVKVNVTDAAITLSHKSARRGWAADFVVRNTGKKAHQFEIGGLQTPVIKPGAQKILKVNFELRGEVTYKDPLNAKAPAGTFKVI